MMTRDDSTEGDRCEKCGRAACLSNSCEPCPFCEVERLVKALFTIRRLTIRRDGLEHVARVAVDAVLSYDEPQQPSGAAEPKEDE